MLCWRNILPSSQHFLSTSNIPKFSSITNFLLPISGYLIISKYQCFWQEAPLVRAYSPVPCYCLRVIYIGLLPVIASYLYWAPFSYCIGSPRNLYSSVPVSSIQTDQFYPISC